MQACGESKMIAAQTHGKFPKYSHNDRIIAVGEAFRASVASAMRS
jgi:hypothetical protein